MTTFEHTNEPSELDTNARAKQDALTQKIGTRLAVPDAKAPWWKRLLGRG